MLIGNLGKNPEIRSTQNGGKVANMSIATSESWKDKSSGERKERTEWHKISIFGPLAEIVEKYLSKGSKVYLEGQLQTRKWTDQSGTEKYTTEVVIPQYGGKLIMLDSKGERKSSGGASQGATQPAEPADDLDDSVPF